MTQRVLITGGAGFIGSHLADELLEHGYAVRVLDCLCPQVHEEGGKHPEYLSPEVELMVGDVRDRRAVQKALQGVDAVLMTESEASVVFGFSWSAGMTTRPPQQSTTAAKPGARQAAR